MEYRDLVVTSKALKVRTRWLTAISNDWSAFATQNALLSHLALTAEVAFPYEDVGDGAQWLLLLRHCRRVRCIRVLAPRNADEDKDSDNVPEELRGDAMWRRMEQRRRQQADLQHSQLFMKQAAKLITANQVRCAFLTCRLLLTVARSCVDESVQGSFEGCRLPVCRLPVQWNPTCVNRAVTRARSSLQAHATAVCFCFPRENRQV